MIESRFGVSNLPDSFVYLPEQLGGLGLRNPFVGLFLVRNKITETPEDIINEYLKHERDTYLESKKIFEALPESALQYRLRAIYPFAQASRPSHLSEEDVRTFFSLEEYSRNRERYNKQFYSTVQKLVSVPETEEIALGDEVYRGLREFLLTDGMPRLDSEKKWFLQLYAREILEDFGGLSLVDKQFLPVGVLAMMRGRKVSWNMVL
jgi:hypothetical protein